MESLKLDKQQRSQLLKMAKKLYPEYYWKPVYEGDDIDNEAYLDKSGVFHFETIVKIRKNSTQYEFIEIHWYEFCLLHLAEKILNDGSLFNWVTIKYNSWICKALIEQVHPVDYLFEQFEKMKL